MEMFIFLEAVQNKCWKWSVARSPNATKIILGDLIWSEIHVFVARRTMFGGPTLNLCMHSKKRVMSVQTGCTSLQFIL